MFPVFITGGFINYLSGVSKFKFSVYSCIAEPEIMPIVSSILISCIYFLLNPLISHDLLLVPGFPCATVFLSLDIEAAVCCQNTCKRYDRSQDKDVSR